MKQLYDEHKNRIGLIHRVEDRNNYRNSLLFDFHKMIDLTEDFQEAEASREVEVFRVEEASQAEEDIQEAEEYRLEDHQEAAGDHRHCPCHRSIKENW